MQWIRCALPWPWLLPSTSYIQINSDGGKTENRSGWTCLLAIMLSERCLVRELQPMKWWPPGRMMLYGLGQLALNICYIIKPLLSNVTLFVDRAWTTSKFCNRTILHIVALKISNNDIQIHSTRQKTCKTAWNCNKANHPKHSSINMFIPAT